MGPYVEHVASREDPDLAGPIPDRPGVFDRLERRLLRSNRLDRDAGAPEQGPALVLRSPARRRANLAVPLLGLDSDNGLEFINAQLYHWCIDQEITFTRSRPYRKNDNCFVEQKNFPVVRQQVGYLRYETAVELEVLGELYRHLRLYVNFFQPQMAWSRRSVPVPSSRAVTTELARPTSGPWTRRSSPRRPRTR